MRVGWVMYLSVFSFSIFAGFLFLHRSVWMVSPYLSFSSVGNGIEKDGHTDGWMDGWNDKCLYTFFTMMHV